MSQVQEADTGLDEHRFEARKAGSPPVGKTWAGKSRYLLLAVVALVLDQWSKWMIEAHLGELGRVEVIPGLLNLIHVRNTGVAFGLFAARGDVAATWTLTLLGLAALAFVTYYFYLVPRRARMLLVALSLIIGGAVGNLLDRAAQGGVTDFIDFYYGGWHWHTFNVADTAITVGIGLMILGSWHPIHSEAAAESTGSTESTESAQSAESDPIREVTDGP